MATLKYYNGTKWVPLVENGSVTFYGSVNILPAICKKGDMYIISESFTDGNETYNKDDTILYDGSEWIKIQGGIQLDESGSSAENNSYVTGLSVNNGKLSVTSKSLPNLNITNSGKDTSKTQYVSNVAKGTNSHDVTVTYTTLPTIPSLNVTNNGKDTSKTQYVSSVTKGTNSHDVTITYTNLPTIPSLNVTNSGKNTSKTQYVSSVTKGTNSHDVTVTYTDLPNTLPYSVVSTAQPTNLADGGIWINPSNPDDNKEE